MDELSDRVAQAIWGCGMDATYREQGVAALAVMTDALAASASRIEAARGYLQTIVDTTAKTGTASGKWHEACVSIAKRGLAALDAAPRSYGTTDVLASFIGADEAAIARTIDDEVK